MPPPPGSGSSLPPGELGAVKMFFIVSMIVHAMAGLMWLVVLKAGILACGIGCVLVVVPALLVAAIVFDATAIKKLEEPPSPAAYSTLRTAAILDIISGALSFSVIPFVMGILALLNIQKPQIRQYYGVG